jgi:hypothetical protein
VWAWQEKIRNWRDVEARWEWGVWWQGILTTSRYQRRKGEEGKKIKVREGWKTDWKMEVDE